MNIPKFPIPQVTFKGDEITKLIKLIEKILKG